MTISSPSAIGREETVDGVGRQHASRRRSARAAPGHRRTARGHAVPSSGSSKIRGYFPFSSHDMKNGDQSMNGTICSSGIAQSVRVPRNAGTAIGDRVPVDLEAGAGRPRHRGRACAELACRRRRGRAPAPARFWRSSSARASARPRRSTTPTLLEASLTWMTMP